ncbi:MAG: ATP-grasp domain-containing protein [Acidimicrobiia bacterium]|nr:ATP-grasp domain-containing protein [Acidimicrobiia bacterium]
MKILIANRGEIARRVIRTARRLGHRTVAVYADPDAQAPFVFDADESHLLGPAALAESYLSIDRLIEAVKATGADAVHPGYGFLSENAAFARAVESAGAIWIGPHPGAIDEMGSKIDARRLATEAGVPVIPGFDRSQDRDALAAAAERIGYPILVKAAAGGGGKGIRIAQSPDQFDTALSAASEEARRAFGDGAVIVERYITRPRHVEVQIVGDRGGNTIHLGTRECSVQRRYQKLLEEAPAPNLPHATCSGLQASAVALAASIGYDSTGTVEFIVDDSSSDYFFLEMNTRLQVEHPVTEEVTGLDLVELQLAVAGGGRLPLSQDQVSFTGHAFEARINAEDPANGFAPQTGKVSALVVPDRIRWDSGVVEGSVISPHYDSMVAKLIAAGPDRETARRRLATALDELVVGGLTTNVGFHRWLVDQAAVVDGRVTTRFLDETELPPAPPLAVDEAAAAYRSFMVREHRLPSADPWHRLGATDFRLTPHRPSPQYTLIGPDGSARETTGAAANPNTAAGAVVRFGRPTTVTVKVDGHAQTFTVLSRTEAWAAVDEEASGRGGSAVWAPFPASVAEVHVAPGDEVHTGDALVVIEAMKMLHTLSAKAAHTVDEVRVSVGDQVESNQILITFVQPEEPADDQ